MSTLLELKNLSKSFGGIHAVNNVSFSVNRGEILGLIGPNGSGKTTCINIISGVYTLDSGEVIFDGKPIQHESIYRRARAGVGRTFQSPKPFTGLSVFESVYTVALQRHSFNAAREKATDILNETKLLELKDVPCEKLPIEKRKWLDLARILANDPKLIMMDEVMAGLNPSEITQSLDLVRKINEMGITVLFIEHVMKAVVQLCKRVVVLNEGKFLDEGDTLTVMKNPAIIKAYLGDGYHVENG